jgi:hypothetical protein
VIRAYRSPMHRGTICRAWPDKGLAGGGFARKLSPEVQNLLGAFRFHRSCRHRWSVETGVSRTTWRSPRTDPPSSSDRMWSNWLAVLLLRQTRREVRPPARRGASMSSTAMLHPAGSLPWVRIQSGFGPQSALHLGWRKGEDMMTILIIVLVLFVIGGGGWGYSRWRG